MILHNQIGFLYQTALKPILFQLDPEKVHNLFTNIGRLLGTNSLTRSSTKFLFNYKNKKLEQNILGISFSNPVGLSAGFDKDANLINILDTVGFGFMQVGSITNLAYEGNPAPRLYRLKKSMGLVVYYGLKNIGVDKIIQKLKKKKKKDFPLSISIAKTNCKNTSTTEGGIEDYYQCVKKVVEENIGDFYTINISCPNTFGGEPFTTPEKLEALLQKLTSLNVTKPIFVKMPLELAWNDFDSLLQIVVKYKLAGVIIANLVKDRNNTLIVDKIPQNIKGGISGKPTFELSNTKIAKTYVKYGKKLVIIGVGGIFSAEDAYKKIKLGASLVQLITGMIFEGPQLIGQINKGLVELIKKDGFSNISEAIGIDARNYISK
ncbi:quinone-dependent dihydroorotate dehydrogenase [Candidatus Dojkabacteria bacterium]|uniref:Dihydroorotate dehydrogenase (quinone) n=1 Tax=Candidatus Dojkabacteria bacterium TaxID=2099670 RepID=A0A955RG72_9BACT|nr:quinone-dependent dihydroorotate dehydrogenase [Candidatus Dojkabacteria bacterium]